MKLSFLLTLWVLYPGDEAPRVKDPFEVPSIERCLELATKALAVDPHSIGAIAIGAGCSKGYLQATGKEL
jgi:hypothetical protein